MPRVPGPSDFGLGNVEPSAEGAPFQRIRNVPDQFGGGGVNFTALGGAFSQVAQQLTVATEELERERIRKLKLDAEALNAQLSVDAAALREQNVGEKARGHADLVADQRKQAAEAFFSSDEFQALPSTEQHALRTYLDVNAARSAINNTAHEAAQMRAASEQKQAAIRGLQAEEAIAAGFGDYSDQLLFSIERSIRQENADKGIPDDVSELAILKMRSDVRTGQIEELIDAGQTGTARTMLKAYTQSGNREITTAAEDKLRDAIKDKEGDSRAVSRGDEIYDRLSTKDATLGEMLAEVRRKFKGDKDLTKIETRVANRFKFDNAEEEFLTKERNEQTDLAFIRGQKTVDTMTQAEKDDYIKENGSLAPLITLQAQAALDELPYQLVPNADTRATQLELDQALENGKAVQPGGWLTMSVTELTDEYSTRLTKDEFELRYQQNREYQRDQAVAIETYLSPEEASKRRAEMADKVEAAVANTHDALGEFSAKDDREDKLLRQRVITQLTDWALDYEERNGRAPSAAELRGMSTVFLSDEGEVGRLPAERSQGFFDQAYGFFFDADNDSVSISELRDQIARSPARFPEEKLRLVKIETLSDETKNFVVEAQQAAGRPQFEQEDDLLQRTIVGQQAIGRQAYASALIHFGRRAMGWPVEWIDHFWATGEDPRNAPALQ